MLIKKADNKSAGLAQLEALSKSPDARLRNAAEEELRKVRAGLKGESDSAYYIDFDYAKSPDMAILHDLRLEIHGRIAQIDHLLIHRSLHCFVLETKQFHAGLKITETGEFLRWNNWTKQFEGMASPLAQNERHISVLRDALREVLSRKARMPAPVFHSYILVPVGARIDRPVHFDTRQVIAADALRKALQTDLEQANGSQASSSALETLARRLVDLHKPALLTDYKKKFSASRPAGMELSPLPEASKTLPKRGKRANSRFGIAMGRQVAYLGVLALLLGMGFPLTTHLLPLWATALKQPDLQSLMPSFVASPAHPDKTVPPAHPSTPAELPPSVRINEHSLTVTGKKGTPIAEIHGNLPKIKQEMRQSRLGAHAVHPEREVAGPTNCQFKPVMTDQEIAACRQRAKQR